MSCYYNNFGLSDSLALSCKIDDLMKEEVDSIHKVIDTLHLKHKEYTDMIQAYTENNSVEQSEIKHLEGTWNYSFIYFVNWYLGLQFYILFVPEFMHRRRVNWMYFLAYNVLFWLEIIYGGSPPHGPSLF